MKRKQHDTFARSFMKLICFLLALILMAGLRWPSTRAMPLAWLVGALLAWSVWDIAPMRLLALSIEGTITAVGVLIIVFGALIAAFLINPRAGGVFAVTIPVLHMIALTRDALKARGVKCAGLLATDGTVQTGIYQRTFEQSGVALFTPDSADDQAAVMDVIYNGVKAGDLTHDVAAFRAACEHLLARGAEVLILGCTELPPAFELYRLDYPNVDPTLELALGAIRAAGCETK